jgi:hypothetical protein
MIASQEKAIGQLEEGILGIHAQAAQERKLMQEQINESKRMRPHTPHDIERIQAQTADEMKRIHELLNIIALRSTASPAWTNPRPS